MIGPLTKTYGKLFKVQNQCFSTLFICSGRHLILFKPINMFSFKITVIS